MSDIEVYQPSISSYEYTEKFVVSRRLIAQIKPHRHFGWCWPILRFEVPNSIVKKCILQRPKGAPIQVLGGRFLTSISWPLATSVKPIEENNVDIKVNSFWEVKNNVNESRPATICEQRFQQTTDRFSCIFSKLAENKKK